MSCNCQEIAEKGKQKVEESLAMQLLHDSQRNAKRWFTAWIVTFLLLLSVLGGIIYIVLTSDITTENIGVNADNGIANYVGNDNSGDIDNGFYPSKKDKN